MIKNLAESAFRLNNSKWRGLQPKNPYKEGGRYVFTPQQYSEYCATHPKEARRKCEGYPSFEAEPVSDADDNNDVV